MANVEEKKNELDDKKIFTSNAQRTTTVAKGETDSSEIRHHSLMRYASKLLDIYIQWVEVIHK